MERERRFPASASLGARVTHWWAGLGLTSQFMLASSLVLAACMLFFGYSIANRTSDSVVQHNAAAAALYADSFIETRVQELRLQSRLSEENQRALDELFRPQSAGQPIVAFRIWRGDTVVHSNERELIGKAFPKSALRERAWSGQIVAEYGWAEAADSMSANRSAVRMLEIYAPVHDTGTGRIIALAQTRQIAPMLSAELSRASIESWLLVGFITLHMVALQYLIVRRGSRTIEEQRASLAERIGELSRLLAENDQLRQRADRANRRVTEVNERYLRQIGADLHDGPVQLLGMAVLRLDVLQQVVEEGAPAIADEANGEIAVLQDALRDTLVEIRSLSAGLAPPEIESMSLQAILEMIGRRHERRTGMPVVCDVDGLPEEVPLGDQVLPLPVRPGGPQQCLPTCRRAGAVDRRALRQGPHRGRGRRQRSGVAARRADGHFRWAGACRAAGPDRGAGRQFQRGTGTARRHRARGKHRSSTYSLGIGASRCLSRSASRRSTTTRCFAAACGGRWRGRAT